jgi:hypothetical protein
MSSIATAVHTRDARVGYTLAEALVVLLLLFGLLHGAWTLAAVHGSSAFEIFERSQMLEAARVSGWVLREELRGGVPGMDWWQGEDSLALRAFRSLGITCEEGSEPGTLVVESTGLRAPDPGKDSVLVLWPDGRWRAHDLVGRSAGASCTPGGPPAERWRIEPPEVGGLVVRVFERGSYHVGDGAFRYRRGAGGRQPLTAPVLGASSELRWDLNSVVLNLAPSRDAGPGWRNRQRLWSAPRP